MESEVSVVRTELGDDVDPPALRALLTEYFTEANRLGREWFDDEEFGADAEEIVSADIDRLQSAAVDAPLFAARTPERLAGSVQIKRLDDHRVEVKRLYVRPQYRGDGIGRALVRRLIEEMRTEGFETLLLGVSPYHEGAQSLYLSLGFEWRSKYEENAVPPSLREDWQFMEYSLVD